MEPEFYRMLQDKFSVHTARMRLHKVTVGTLSSMEKKSIKAAKELSDAKVSVVGYGCTSGSFYKGIRHQEEIAGRIEKASKAPCVTTAGAVVSALKALEVNRVATATPYTDRINELERKYLASNGIEIADLRGLGLVDNIEIGKQEPGVAYHLARHLRHSEADGIFISCTNFRTIEIVEKLEQEIGKPVVSSNTATAWAMLKKARLESSIVGFGRIFSK
jgi:maleate isomerase